MNTRDIGTRLVELIRAGKDREAQDELYAAGAVSVEAAMMQGMDRTTRGLHAIKAKGQSWYSTHKVHKLIVTGPFPHDDRFIVTFEIDVTNTDSGQRIQMQEAGLYTVANGKIVKEEFFYAAE